ncbi:MAG TPA: serine hydrolase domain-containing protein [Spirochaetia bacterium]|nr:serine hydrolase domain-containing protein [Spirochaetia bacterium]
MLSPHELPRSDPESQGVDSAAIAAFLDAADTAVKDLHSFMVLRHGVVIAEGWWRPYRPDVPHMLFSLSKSFTSTAAGLAVSDGLLSVEDRVLSFFPEDAPRKVSDNLARMRVRDLLTMTTGHAEEATRRTFARPDRRAEKAFLSTPVEYAPGTHFVYNTAATYMVSAIVQKRTGKTLVQYLTPRLFEPLGIREPIWDSYANGVNFGGFGLHLRTEDIARFGQLYLNRGLWNGKRLLSESWVEEATARQVPNGNTGNPDWIQGYGYQFWRCQPRGVYRGDGAFGQYCIVMPEQDAVVAITSGVSDMQAVLTALWKTLLPALGAEPTIGAQMAAGAGAQPLETRLQSLRRDPPQGPSTSPRASGVDGVTYRFEANAQKLTSVRFRFCSESCAVTVVRGRHRDTVEAGYGEWRSGSLALPYETTGVISDRPVVASCRWVEADALELTVRQTGAPFVYTWRCRFGDRELLLDSTVNVAFDPTPAPTLRALAPSPVRSN